MRTSVPTVPKEFRRRTYRTAVRLLVTGLDRVPQHKTPRVSQLLQRAVEQTAPTGPEIEAARDIGFEDLGEREVYVYFDIQGAAQSAYEDVRDNNLKTCHAVVEVTPSTIRLIRLQPRFAP